MPRYHFFIEATNVMLIMDGELTRGGFFTSRIITQDSDDAAAAQSALWQLIDSDPQLLQCIKNDPRKDPPAYFKIIDMRIAAPDECQMGHAFYRA